MTSSNGNPWRWVAARLASYGDVLFQAKGDLTGLVRIRHLTLVRLSKTEDGGIRVNLAKTSGVELGVHADEQRLSADSILTYAAPSDQTVRVAEELWGMIRQPTLAEVGALGRRN